MSVVELWFGSDDSDKVDNTRIELNRLEDEGRWQFSFEDGLFPGYPFIKLDRKNLKDLHEALEAELYPERLRHEYPSADQL